MMSKTEVHMGEIMDAVVDMLKARGLTVDRDSIVFRFAAGREHVVGTDAFLSGGSYLTAICNTEPTLPR